MKVSFITTVLNEEKNIELLLNSLVSQSKRPDEVIIVDGGSKDHTVKVVKEWIAKLRSKDFKKKVKLITIKGNRSVGRNEAVRLTKGDIIVCSDSGCILDKKWVREIVKPFEKKDVDVVAGFYKGLPKNIFEKSLVPYVLLMPDRVNPKNFLPSTRSMAFKKSIFRKVGGFPQKFSYNEDYVFAKMLKKRNAKIVFKKSAIVYWKPRENLKDAFIMFYRFAMGDIEASIFRSKVFWLLIRYIIMSWFLVYLFYFKVPFILKTILYILIIYILWAIWKNYRYVKNWQAFFVLPLIQFTADTAVLGGTIFGFLKSLWDTRERR